MRYLFDRLTEGSTWIAFLIAGILFVGSMFVPQEDWRTGMLILGIAIGVGGFFYSRK